MVFWLCGKAREKARRKSWMLASWLQSFVSATGFFYQSSAFGASSNQFKKHPLALLAAGRGPDAFFSAMQALRQGHWHPGSRAWFLWQAPCLPEYCFLELDYIQLRSKTIGIGASF
jgi:hypothetical protein